MRGRTEGKEEESGMIQKVFIGYDSHEQTAFHVLSASIMEHASKPVAIIPLIQRQLREMGIYTRQTGPTEATEFSLTRFLVPYLSDFKGMSIFVDCDMLFQADIHDVMKHVELRNAVSVCQHDYLPRTETKMGGKRQTFYPRKNWSSFMVFNNCNFDCQRLTPQFVNSANASDLQRLTWTDRIGSLPLEWNWLVGEYEDNPDAKVLHWTLGGVWFDPWYKQFAKLTSSA